MVSTPQEYGAGASGAAHQAPAKQISRRRPIFPGSCPPSIFGAGELNFRVRDGNGWFLSASVTGIFFNCDPTPRMGRVNRLWKHRFVSSRKSASSHVLDA